mmetsp:Transcript_17481/g.45481  ORF Transcript_17481/g.45481 Transcript_17481/m.45481 type:complete len:221 (-) Transcript_17481:405-1067(-)
MEMLKPVTDVLETYIEKFPPPVKEQLTKLEEKNPAFKPAYVVGGVALIPFFLVIYALGGFKLVINLVGFVYPAFKSFKVRHHPPGDPIAACSLEITRNIPSDPPSPPPSSHPCCCSCSSSSSCAAHAPPLLWYIGNVGQAIESKSKDDDTQWLTYWVVYGVFNIMEHAMAFVVMMIPYYGLFKMGFLIFCYHPNTMGATKIYTTVLKPYVVPYIVREKKE